jgi:hypothetical protein
MHWGKHAAYCLETTKYIAHAMFSSSNTVIRSYSDCFRKILRHKFANITTQNLDSLQYHRIENRPEASLSQNYVRDFSCAGASQQV